MNTILSDSGTPRNWGVFLLAAACAIVILPVLIVYWATVALVGLVIFLGWLGMGAERRGDVAAARMYAYLVLIVIGLAIVVPLYRSFGSFGPVVLFLLAIGGGMAWLRRPIELPSTRSSSGGGASKGEGR